MERYLVNYCAPTLAGLKPANLFTYTFQNAAELEDSLALWNQLLNPKGIQITVIQQREDTAQVYVYRPERLRALLHEPETADFLHGCGYRDLTLTAALRRLQERFQPGGAFPHEIGLFLGYPLGDVKGFIQNAGRNCKCLGCWKVYCNEAEAVCQFARFNKCRDVYVKLWNRGRSVSQLTVAA